jgi:hypothetical protein
MHAAEQRWLDVAEQCQTAAQGAETRRVEAMEEGDRAAAIVRWARWASAIEGDAVSAAATAAAAAAAAAAATAAAAAAVASANEGKNGSSKRRRRQAAARVEAAAAAIETAEAEAEAVYRRRGAEEESRTSARAKWVASGIASETNEPESEAEPESGSESTGGAGALAPVTAATGAQMVGNDLLLAQRYPEARSGIKYQLLRSLKN